MCILKIEFVLLLICERCCFVLFFNNETTIPLSYICIVAIFSQPVICLLYLTIPSEEQQFFILRIFIKGCWIFSKAFSGSIEITIWFLSISLLIWCITLIDLQILKNPCTPGIKPTWSWCMIFLMCCWILIARILRVICGLYCCLSFMKYICVQRIWQIFF